MKHIFLSSGTWFSIIYEYFENSLGKGKRNYLYGVNPEGIESSTPDTDDQIASYRVRVTLSLLYQQHVDNKTKKQTNKKPWNVCAHASNNVHVSRDLLCA